MLDPINHLSVLVLLIAIWSFVEWTDDNAPFTGVGALAGVVIFVIFEVIVWPVWYLFVR